MWVRASQIENKQMRRGDLVEVRSAPEILATLDVSACLEGVSLMPEILTYVGRRLSVVAGVRVGGRTRRHDE
jgi:hypothetical protein